MANGPKKLLIATNNAGKIAELKAMLAGISVELLCLTDFPDAVEVAETGLTFAENAALKATDYALQTGQYALADDSGLEVTALGGRPGVFSARYGGEGTSFKEKMELLLAEMAESGIADRSARFVCSIAIADADGNIVAVAEGVCEGAIAAAPRGDGGFGYDPLFVPDGYNQTFGELSGSVKQKISHRSQAFRQIIPFLGHFSTL